MEKQGQPYRCDLSTTRLRPTSRPRSIDANSAKLGRMMTLNITDPAILFPGISLLFLAYTNRYLALAGIVRALNRDIDDQDAQNRAKQIQSLHLRITLIKYMQALGIVSFILCILSMMCLIWEKQASGEVLFAASLIAMIASLLLSLTEVLRSGQSLKIELERTRFRQTR